MGVPALPFDPAAILPVTDKA